MFELNEKIRNLTPYEPISGEYSIRLDANESFMNLSEELMQEAAKALLKTAFNRYPDPLAKALAEGFGAYYSVAPEYVTVFNGSDETISVIMNAFLQKGDKFMTLEPDFSMYRFYGELAEGHSVRFEKNGEDFSVDADAVIEKANAENVRVIIFSNPCNPTSCIIKKEELRRIIGGVNALVVLDEAYMDFDGGESLLSEFLSFDNLVILKTCSKALGAAALRLGFAVAGKKITGALRAVKSPYNVNSVSQALASALFSHPDYISGCTKKVISSREELYRGALSLKEKYPVIGNIPRPHTNFIFMEVENAPRVFEKLKERGIIVRNMGGHLRITAGTGYENEKTLKAIGEILEG